MNFVTMIENQYKIVPKTIITNNGPEFSLTSFYTSKEIHHKKSCVETPQKEGRL